VEYKHWWSDREELELVSIPPGQQVRSSGARDIAYTPGKLAAIANNNNSMIIVRSS
jgi:hypothetical protein